MSFLTTNYENNQSNTYGALPQGEYEMVINKAYEDATPNGAENFTIDLIVRNDLEKVPALAETNGKYANRHVFNQNWKRKATNQYDLESFQYILEAVGVPEGTQIASIDDFAKILVGKPVKVYVKKEVDEYNTTDPDNPEYRNQVAPWNYSKSDYPNIQHQFKDDDKNNQQTTKEDNPFSNVSSGSDISNDDLPF